MTSSAASESAACPSITWADFWFAPRPSYRLATIRVVTGSLLVAYFLAYATQLGAWLPGSGGVASSGTVDRLLTRGWWEFSIFDYCRTLTAVRIVHGVALMAAVAMTLGIFTRWSTILAWLLFLSYFHRMPFANGLAEPFFAMLLPYLAINPGRWSVSVDRWWQERKGGEIPGETCWSATFATRLIQLHLTGLILMTVTNRLAGEPWWSGMSVWWLIAKTETRLIDLTGLAGEPRFYLVNLWTHLIVAVELSAVALLWIPRTRSWTILGLCGVWASLLLLTGDVLWVGLSCAAVSAFGPAERRRGRWRSEGTAASSEFQRPLAK